MTVPDFRQPGRDVDGVLDTSVLVNFLRIDRMDLLAVHSRGFVVTDHVSEEITECYPDQQKRFIVACREGILDRKSVTVPRAWKLFESLVKTRVLGVGECSAIALAECLNFALFTDDRRAAKHAFSLASNLLVLGTQDLVVEMIHQGFLSVAEADEIKETWEKHHRFRLKIRSFADVL